MVVQKEASIRREVAAREKIKRTKRLTKRCGMNLSQERKGESKGKLVIWNKC